MKRASRLRQRIVDALKAFPPPLRCGAGFDIREMVRQIVAGDVPEAKELYPRRVDDVAPQSKGIPSGGGGGVPAFAGVAADFLDAKIQLGLDGADEAALPDAA